MSLQQLSSRHRWQNFQLSRCRVPHVSDALTRNPTEKLILELAVEQSPRGLSVALVELRCAVVDEYGEGRFRLANEAQKRTAFLQQLVHMVDVDDRHDELRLEQRHGARAFVSGANLFDRFCVEWIQRPLGFGFVVKRPELLRDVPGHDEVASRYFRRR